MQVKHSTLDLDRARDIGLKLQAGRESLNLPASKVANILLLSRHQVESLEAGDASVFYNPQFYVQAADKYAAFLELTPAPSETLFEQVLALAESVEIPLANTSTRPVKRIIVVAVLVVIAAGIYLQRNLVSDFISAQWPVAPTAESIPSAPAVLVPKPAPFPVTVLETPAPAPTIERGTVVIQFSGSSWVQVVSADGTKQEHTYKAGETLTVEPAKLQALIIGNVEVATAETAKGSVSLNTYTSAGSKVARIIGPAARALGAPSQTNRISGNH